MGVLCAFRMDGRGRPLAEEKAAAFEQQLNDLSGAPIGRMNGRNAQVLFFGFRK